MNLSPYQKLLNYLCLLGLLSIVAVGSIGLFITHTEQPTIYSIFAILSIMILGVIIIGYLRLRLIHKKGQIKHWYQKIEIIAGLGVICMMMIYPTISIFDAFFHTHPLSILYYLEMTTLFFWSFLSLFFLRLCFKNNFDTKQEKIEHSKTMVMDREDDTKGHGQLKW